MSRYHYALSISSVKLITEVRTSVIFREFKRQTYTYQGFNASIISMTRDIIEEFYKLKYCSTVVYMVPRA